jgi:multicomponent Na+:H+ antiporter subunit E
VKRSFSLGLSAVLLGIWILLWGEVTLANLLSGMVVVWIVMLLIPQTDDDLVAPRVRPLWALRFLVLTAYSLVRANTVVAIEAIRQSSRVNTGIVAVPMPGATDGLLTLVANVLGLAPGTMPIEVTTDPPVIYVHVLHLDDVEATRAEIARLANLAVRAFGSDEAVEALT